MEHPGLGPDIVSERRTTLLIHKVRVEQCKLRNLNDRYDVWVYCSKDFVSPK